MLLFFASLREMLEFRNDNFWLYISFTTNPLTSLYLSILKLCHNNLMLFYCASLKLSIDQLGRSRKLVPALFPTCFGNRPFWHTNCNVILSVPSYG